MKTCLLCEGISDTDQEACSECGLGLVETTEVHFPVRRGEEDAANPMLGVIVDGKYRITHVLGKGGMGTVFAAVHQVSLVPVALKVLHQRYAAHAQHRRSFVEEARKAALVAHEHSARILDAGEDPDGTTYIAMELVEGTTLADLMQGDGLDTETLLEVMHQICTTLVAAHQHGVVHRDLSPRNVMVVLREGRPFVKILDFGIAKGAERDDGGALLARFANPPYSAPEHLDGADVDGRADLYSLGVIAYEACSGALPVPGVTARELARATVEGRVRPLRAPPGTPGRLVRLVQRLLERDPTRRPPNAAAVLREIDRLRAPRGRVLKPVAVGVLFVSLLGFVVVRGDSSPPFLQQIEPGPLHFQSEPPQMRETQYLRPADFDDLRFRYGHFAPDGLIAKAGEQEYHLEPVIERGALSLSRDRCEPWRRLVAALASSIGPEMLSFQLPGRPAFCFARVRVDADPPELELTCDTRALNSSSTLIVKVTEQVGLRSVELMASVDGGEPKPIGTSESKAVGEWRVPMDALAAIQSGVSPVRQVTIQAHAVDLARNEATSEPRLFSSVDVRVPDIDSVRGTRKEDVVEWGPNEAQLRLQLDAYEKDMVLRVQGPGPEPKTLELPLHPLRTQTVDLAKGSATTTQRFPDGNYEFRVRDAAGNMSKPVFAFLRFLDVALDDSLRLAENTVAGQARLVARDGRPQIVSDGRPLALLLDYSPLYTVRWARIDVQDGPSQPVAIDNEDGRTRLTLPALNDGRDVLRVQMADVPDGRDAKQLSFVLRVLTSPPRLQVPDVPTGARFLEQLRDAGVLEGSGAEYWPSTHWKLSVEDPSLVEGSVLSGHPNALEVTPWRPQEGRQLPQRLNALRGENVVAVALHDLLNRPVTVLCGEHPAPKLAEDGSAWEIARFHWSPSDPVQIGVAQVEWQRPVPVWIEAALPFLTKDNLTLSIGPTGQAVRVDGESNGGVRLHAELPFVEVKETALPDVPRQQYGSTGPFTVAATLSTPAGTKSLTLTFVTVRSSLRTRTLGDLPGAAHLPPELRSIRMVPVLAPPGGVHRDPVAADAPHRRTFRVGGELDVVGLQDFFLQEGEITRAQYAALAAAAQALAATEPDVVAGLYHRADPAGADRLTRMRPVAMTEEEWARSRAGLAAERPVTGVNFFQAYTACRVAGQLLHGDPDLLRLPTGVEMEVAALGDDPGDDGPHWNAASRAKSWPTYQKMRNQRRYLDSFLQQPGDWPPKLSEAETLCDVVPGDVDGRLVGLDFGVREWVFDLPWLPTKEGEGDILRVWLGNQEEHLKWAKALARGSDVPEYVAGDARRLGAVRGVASGETLDLVDPTADGSSADAEGPLPPTVPGVTRTVLMRRDGKFLGGVDRRLRLIGFRLAGGASFVAEARR